MSQQSAKHNKQLTERQAQVLSVILRTYRDEARSPSIREIGEELGISSTNGVNDHLKALLRKDYVEHHATASRGWVPVRDLDGSPVLVAVVREEEGYLLQFLRGLSLDPDRVVELVQAQIQVAA